MGQATLSLVVSRPLPTKPLLPRPSSAETHIDKGGEHPPVVAACGTSLSSPPPPGCPVLLPATDDSSPRGGGGGVDDYTGLCSQLPPATVMRWRGLGPPTSGGSLCLRESETVGMGSLVLGPPPPRAPPPATSRRGLTVRPPLPPGLAPPLATAGLLPGLLLSVPAGKNPSDGDCACPRAGFTAFFGPAAEISSVIIACVSLPVELCGRAPRLHPAPPPVASRGPRRCPGKGKHVPLPTSLVVAALAAPADVCD